MCNCLHQLGILIVFAVTAVRRIEDADPISNFQPNPQLLLTYRHTVLSTTGPCIELKYFPALLPARFLGDVTCVVFGQPRALEAAILKLFCARTALWVII